MSVTVLSAPAGLSSANRRTDSPWRSMDIWLLSTTVALAGLGLLMISSATYRRQLNSGLDPHLYLKKQVLYMVIGAILMAGIALIDYRYFVDRAALWYVLGLCGLAGVLVLGSVHKGARNWYDFGPFQLQPSEFSKIVVIMALAAYGGAQRTVLDGRRFMIMLFIAGLPVGLIYLEPDLGTSLVFLSVTVTMLWVAGGSGRHIGLLVAAGVAGVIFVLRANLLDPFQVNRLLTFLHPSSDPGGAGFNLQQSIQAIGSGGLRGAGLYRGALTTLAYVPEQRTDFIFTAVGEQLGLIGGGLFLLLFLILCWRTVRTAAIARDTAGSLICVGVLAMFVFQIFENIGMTMGIMPITGIPLPLLSYGGSSILASFAGIGLVLNVGMHRYR